MGLENYVYFVQNICLNNYALETAIVSDMDRTKWIILTKYKCFKVSR